MLLNDQGTNPRRHKNCTYLCIQHRSTSIRNTNTAAAAAAAAAAKSLQSCLTLCDLIDGSPLGSAIHGIFQARVLEWGAIAFSEDNL